MNEYMKEPMNALALAHTPVTLPNISSVSFAILLVYAAIPIETLSLSLCERERRIEERIHLYFCALTV